MFKIAKSQPPWNVWYFFVTKQTYEVNHMNFSSLNIEFINTQLKVLVTGEQYGECYQLCIRFIPTETISRTQPVRKAMKVFLNNTTG